jgi:hypothetical protein
MPQIFCNVPQHEMGGMGAGVCQWPIGMTVKYSVLDPLPGFDKDSFFDLMKEAITPWDEVSGVVTQATKNPAEANILIGVRRIDGPQGVLAEAELPCGNVNERTQLRVWGDSSDQWIVAENPPSGRVDVIRVYRHEFGHSFGIGHNQDGVKNALMDPYVSDIRTLQEWDIAQQVLRYGEDILPPPVGGDGADLVDLLLICLRKLSTDEKVEYARLLKELL